MIASLARNWWALALRGLAAVIFGVLAYLWPELTLNSLVLLFGAYALVDGVFALLGAFRSQGDRRWALVLEGMAGIAAGLVAFIWPGAATVALLYLIAGWAILTGLFEIAAAIRLREELEGEWILMVSGLLSILFGLAAAVWPAAGLLAIAWLIGAYAILFGTLLIALAFRLRGSQGEQPASYFGGEGRSAP